MPSAGMVVLVGGIALDVLAAIRAVGSDRLIQIIITSPANEADGVARANALLPYGASALGIILASILSGTSPLVGNFFVGTLALLYLLYAVKYSPFAVAANTGQAVVLPGKKTK